MKAIGCKILLYVNLKLVRNQHISHKEQVGFELTVKTEAICLNYRIVKAYFLDPPINSCQVSKPLQKPIHFLVAFLKCGFAHHMIVRLL